MWTYSSIKFWMAPSPLGSSQVERFGGSQGEEFSHEFRHMPVRRQSAWKVSDVTGLQSVRRAALLANRHFAFENLHELVPREDPLELACRTTPEAGRQELVVGLHEDRAACRRRSLLNPGRVDWHGRQLKRCVGGGDQWLCHMLVTRKGWDHCGCSPFADRHSTCFREEETSSWDKAAMPPQ